MHMYLNIPFTVIAVLILGSAVAWVKLSCACHENIQGHFTLRAGTH